MTFRIGLLALLLACTKPDVPQVPAPTATRQSLQPVPLIKSVEKGVAEPPRASRRRAAVPQPATKVYREAFIRVKPEDRVPDRICITMDDKPQYGGCVDVARDQVDVVVEFVGPADFKVMRWTSMHAEGVIRPTPIGPAQVPNPF